MRRVAITGIGIISPCGNVPEEFFRNLSEGRSAIARLPEELSSRLTTRIAASVRFDADAHFAPARLRMLDRVSQIALLAAAQALTSAGLALEPDERRDVGVFFGTGMGGAASMDEGYVTLYREGSDRVKPFSVLLAMSNAAGSWIAIEHRLGGPNLTFSTACSSSAVAIGEAWLRIRSGAAQILLAGGAEAPLTYGTLKAWEALKTMAVEDPRDPAASCKPFAKDRSGLVLGEGAALLVLEDWEHALSRGAHLHGELVGYGLSTDTEHITRPTVEGQARAMSLALASARVSASEIGYINAHGTGTTANDPVETKAIREVFGAHARDIPISSTKSMHGHLLGAAGAVELIATLLTLQNGVIPPTINLDVPDPECDLDYVPNTARRAAQMEMAISNSFAFGGTNAVLVCRKGVSPAH